MEGDKSTSAGAEVHASGNRGNETRQFSSYHANPNFRPSGGARNGPGPNRSGYKNNYRHNNNSNKNNPVFAPQKLSQLDAQNNVPSNSGEFGQEKRNKQSENFVSGSNSQNVNPNPLGGGGGKKFRPNRRRHGGNNNQPGAQMTQHDERLNKSLNKERTPENSFVSVGDDSSNRQIPVSISLDNFNSVCEQKCSPKRSLRGKCEKKSGESPGNSHDSNTIIEDDLMVSCTSLPSQHYEVSSNDPLAEMFKHAATTIYDISAVNSTLGVASESSFYSTPLNHTLPSKYEAFNSTGNVAGSVTSETTAYFSVDRTSVSDAPPRISHDIMVSSMSSSSSSPDRVVKQSQSQSEDSQALVTASEGETSFGVEPTIENTITIESTFGNEIENPIKIEQLIISPTTTIVKQVLEDLSQGAATDSSTKYASTSSSAAEEAETQSSSPVSNKSGESDFLNEINELLKQTKNETNNIDDDETTTTSATAKTDSNNYSMQINYPSSTTSECSSERMSASQSQSTSFQKSGDDSEIDIKCDNELIYKNESEIREEVAHLIDKVVSDAITQASKRNIPNESLIEIDINETLILEAEKRNQSIQQVKLNIEPILEQNLSPVRMNQQENIVAFTGNHENNHHQPDEVVSPILAGNISKFERKDTISSEDHADKSSASIGSVNMKLNNQRNPIDCFWCSIL